MLREVASGIGFVDVAISFGSNFHLIELKILHARLLGSNQLAAYMKSEGRKEGWLVLIDVRRHTHANTIPSVIDTPAGKVRTVVVDINPPAPHEL